MIYHIDTDMGIDDALAIAVASRLLGSRMRRLSTVFGNVPLEVATRNAALLCGLLDRDDIEIFAGASAATDGSSSGAEHVHGDDGLGGTTLAFASKRPARPAHALADVGSFDGDEPVVIVAIGPATNVPRLIALYGPQRIARIVLMAGAFFDRGNITPDAEFNAWCDPAALAETMATGLPVVVVPLDVCRKVQLSRPALRSYLRRSRAPAVRLIVEAHDHYMRWYREWEGFDGCFPHDSIALLAALQPERFHVVRGHVELGLGGDARGRTRLTRGGSPVEVVTGGELKWVRELLAGGWLEAAKEGTA